MRPILPDAPRRIFELRLGANAFTAGGLVKPAERSDAFSPHFRGTGYPRDGSGGGTILSTRDDYRQNAVECLRMARGAPDPSDRTVLVNMARTWRMLAENAAAISCFAELVAVEGGIKP
jgi:hypothetical protein